MSLERAARPGNVLDEIDELRRRLAELERRALTAAPDNTHLPELYLGGDNLGQLARHEPTVWTTHCSRLAAIPEGFVWAGAPFVTPGSIAFPNSVMRIYNSDLAGGKAFLYTAGASGSLWHKFAIGGSVTGMEIGCRWDDGTDNNYAEAVVTATVGTPGQGKVLARKRTGGGSVVNSADGSVHYLHETFALLAMAEGTQWSNWSVRPLFYGEIGQPMWQPNVTGLGFTPTRSGLVMYTGGNTLSYLGFYVDAMRV